MSKSAEYANVFAPVLAKAAETATNEKRSLQDRIDGLKTQRDGLDREIKSATQQIAALDDDITVGLAHAARQAGLKLNLHGKTDRNALHTQNGGAAKASDEHLSQLLGAVPEGKRGAMTFGMISKAVKLESKILSDALKRLLAKKEIKSSGERRSKRYFR